jgi:hypothetical protein
MDPDTTYLVALGPDPARALLRAGLWEHALAAVPAGGLAWRAQILADRFWWQLADPGGAEAAVAALAAAVPRYTEALGWAREQGDLMLESYAVRHLGDHALEAGDAGGLDLLRRSYQLRAALGARPHTAAAAATLAAALPPGAEAGQLREAARITATELQLTWLLGSL